VIVDLLLVAAVALGAITLAAIGFVPLLLPWPQRVRWTVAAQAMGDSASALAACPAPALREVVLVSVHDRDDGPVFTLQEAGRGGRDMRIFHAPSTIPTDVIVMLSEWSALRTPMLLYVDDAGIATLTGPAATVTGFRGVVNERCDAPSCAPAPEGPR
jgi:hypothetical protein